MAKYCTNCGKPLKDGEDCTCKREVKIDGEPSVLENYLKDLWTTVKGIFLRPIDTIKTFTKKEDTTLAIIILIIQSILIGFVITVLVNESFAPRLFAYAYQLSSVSLLYQVFFVSVFTALSMSFFFALMLGILSERVSNTKYNYKKMLSLLAIISIIIIVTLLVSLLLFYLSLKLALMVFIFGFLFAFFHLIKGLAIVTKIEENKQGYVFVGGIFLTILFIIYILPIIL